MPGRHNMATVKTCRDHRHPAREHGGRRRATHRRQAVLHDPRPRPVRGDRMGDARRVHPGQGQAGLRAEGRRVPEVLVADGDEHRRPEVLPRPPRLPRARVERAPDDRPRRLHDRRLGPRGRVLRGRGRGRDVRGRAEGDPRQPARVVQLPGLVQRRLRGEAAVLARASSSRSTTRWSRSSTGSAARASSSAAARARASTSRGCARRRSSCRRAATPPGRCRSCAAPTRPPARSSRAARRGARRRWSSSTSTTRTSRSSSGARRRRSARRACSRRRATTCRSTRPTGPRSSTRTRTTPCA